MNDLLSSLSDRYQVERELGRGGMATVYLAFDRKHGRRVAIKVLDPEIAAAIGRDRFLREIQDTARLHHPHILPLHDSGEAAGQLYYVMPYAEGESLRSRLDREKQLSVEEALALTTDVAAALEHAHRQGLIHRDIKPENILLVEGQAVVADFGIARSLQPAPGTRLTTAGGFLGTPIYAAPEQLLDGAAADARSDLYSLACALYEMLAGQPPFTGTTAESLSHQHISVAPRRVTELRPSVPPAVADALARALAKNPADRFTSVSQFAAALGVTQSMASVPASASRSRTRTVFVAAIVLAAIAAAGYGIWVAKRPHALDQQVVAVFPFRVSGNEATVGFLREGMVDLLAANLTGEVGPRAIEPRTTLAAWHRVVPRGRDLSETEAVRLAHGLGAARAVFGSIVSTPGKLLVTAVIRGAGTRDEHRAEAQGPLDSLATIVDRLTAQLLSEATEKSGLEPTELTTRSLPALRAYLLGKAALRQGSYHRSHDYFARALDLDSTFALAATGAVMAAEFGGQDDPLIEREKGLACAGKDRLDPRGRAIVVSLLGPRYPARSPEREIIEAREHAVVVAPGDAEAWFLLGDRLFDHGAFFAVPEARPRARSAFYKAFDLDSSFAALLLHLTEIAFEDGDTASVRRMAGRYATLGPQGEHSDYIRYLGAIALRDEGALTALRAGMERMDPLSLMAISGELTEAGIGVPDAQRAAELAARRAAATQERETAWVAYSGWMIQELNCGRPHRAVEIAQDARALAPVPQQVDFLQMLAAVVSEGDQGVGLAACRRALPFVSSPPPTNRPLLRTHYLCTYAIGLWRLAHGDVASAKRSVKDLLSGTYTRDSVMFVDRTAGRGRILEALVADAEGRRDAAALTRSLDSVLAAGTSQIPEGNLLLARLLERQGDPRAALAALRRQFRGNIAWLSSYLREEGRLAGLTGDRVGAVRAYRRYLALRYDPEPVLKPEVEHVRDELARLEAGRL